jgi:mannose-6-phosphate isomerase
MSERVVPQERIGVPLRLAPVFDPKPWGGRRLERFGKTLPQGSIGESLESGNAARIAGGPFDGATLGDLARTHAAALLGERGITAAGPFHDFPLLVKLIDAQENLSIQVHPGDSDAPPGKRGKTEAWLILESGATGQIVSGITEGLDPSRVGEQIIRTPVRAGDVYLVPAGTIHAIGAGVLLYEIQQASDVTYRVYDWGRDRDMHIAEARIVTRPHQQAIRIEPLAIELGREMLVACRYFALERWRVDGARILPVLAHSCRILTVLDGGVVIGDQEYAAGQSVVLPADLPPTQLDGRATVLCGLIPDLERDVVEPLRSAGHNPERIRELGTSVG